MSLFVGVIFVLGLMLAAYYTFFKTPGEIKDAPASEIVNPKS